MLATIDGSIVVAMIGGGLAMGTGLLGVAWRMGRMEQAIKDLQREIYNGRHPGRERPPPVA